MRTRTLRILGWTVLEWEDTGSRSLAEELRELITENEDPPDDGGFMLGRRYDYADPDIDPDDGSTVIRSPED